jgi:MarR family transcriptional regulator, organic hydroperoxide resistance regulator
MQKTNGGFFVSQIKHLSARVFENLLRENGVEIFNGAQGRILYVLWQHDKLTISEIGRLTSLAKTTLTGMLDRMEEASLIERIPDKNNRRQIFISITDKVKSYSSIYDRISEQMNELFYKGFSEGEIINFENYLKRVITNLEMEGR